MMMKFAEALYAIPSANKLETVLSEARRAKQTQLLKSPLSELALGEWPEGFQSPTPRVLSIEALSDIQEAQITTILERCINDKVEEIRTTAANCLTRSGDVLRVGLVFKHMQSIPWDALPAVEHAVKWVLLNSPETVNEALRSLIQKTHTISYADCTLRQIELILTSAASSLSDTLLNELARLTAKTWESTSTYDTDGAMYVGREEAPANCSSIHALAARELDRRRCC
jgi:hypothetical protein